MLIRQCLALLSPTRVTLAVLGAGYLAVVALTLADQWERGRNAPVAVVWTASELEELQATRQAVVDTMDRAARAVKSAPSQPSTVESGVVVEGVRVQAAPRDLVPGSPTAYGVIADEFIRRARSATKESVRLNAEVAPFREERGKAYEEIEGRIQALYDSVPPRERATEESLKQARDACLERLPYVLDGESAESDPMDRQVRLRVASIILDSEYQSRLHDFEMIQADAYLVKMRQAIEDEDRRYGSSK